MRGCEHESRPAPQPALLRSRHARARNKRDSHGPIMVRLPEVESAGH